VRGKAKGTISNQWRTVMGHLVEQGNQALPYDLWTVAAQKCGYTLDVKAVRDWLRRGVGAQQGFIERHGDTYRVSALAIEKFGFKTAEPPPEVTGDGSA
jgi:hypothetical protein